MGAFGRLVAVMLPLCFAGPLSGQVNVPLIVEEHNGLARSGEVVSMGVPFAVGALRDADVPTLCVRDPAGQPVAAQFQVLNRWWAPRYDNSIRWLLVTFPANTGANGTSQYTLTSGTNPAPTRPVGVSVAGDTYTVDTGAIRAEVRASGFRLFERVWVDADGDGHYAAGEQVVQAAAGDGLVITSGDWPDLGLAAGQVFLASAAPASVTVEESGPVRAVLCITGKFQREGLPEVYPYYEYTVRMYFAAGSPTVRCHVTLRNNRIVDKKVYSWPIEDFSVRTSLSLSGSGQYALLGEGSPVRGTVGAGGAKIYQDSNGTNNWQTLPGSSQEQWLCPWSNGTAVRGVTFRGYQVYDGTASVEQNNYARGWADLADGTVGCAAGVKDFWQQYPKAVRVAGNRMEVALLPQEWSETFHLNQGSRKRHEVTYHFHGGGLSDAAMVDLYLAGARPLFARCAPSVYIASGAWDGGLGSQAPSGSLSSYNKYAVSGTNIGVSYGWDWYGWYYTWNAGGSHANEGSMFLPWILWGDWRKFEQVQNNLLWGDLASTVMFDQPDLSAVWQYLRSWPNVAGAGVTENRYPGYYNRAAWGRPDSGHCGMWQQLEYYYLTGDRHALEQVLYYGQYATFVYYPHFHLGRQYIYSTYNGDPDDPNYMYGDRYWGWPLWNLVQAYEASGDASYLADAPLIVKAVRNSLRQSPLKFAHGVIYNAGSNVGYYSSWPAAVRATAASQAYAIFQMSITARSVGKYFQETGDDDALDVLVAHGDFLVDVAANRDTGGNIVGWPYCWADYWGPNDTAGGGAPATSFHPDLVSALGWAWQFARKPAFTQDLQRIYGSGKIGASNWIYTGYLLAAALNAPSDQTPPAAVTDLRARGRADGSVLVAWTAPGDDGPVGTAARYQLKHSASPLVERVTGWPVWTEPLPMTDAEWRSRANALKAAQLPFVSAWNVDGEPAPLEAGLAQAMVLTLPVGATQHLAIKSLDDENNLSELSNVPAIVPGTWLPGDVDGDGAVNVFDVFVIAESWNRQVGQVGYDPLCDLDEDGFVNVFDVFVLAENWNAGNGQ